MFRNPQRVASRLEILLFYFSIFCGLAACTFVYLRIQRNAWAGDEAYYMQVAKSISSTFIYKTYSVPSKIYDPSMTTNGPLQYLMAGALAATSLENARIIVLTSLFGIFWFSLFWTSRAAACFFFFLLFEWFYYLDCSTRYYGELTAITFCLLGLKTTSNRLTRQPTSLPILGPILFGFAISTKLVVLALVPLLYMIALDSLPTDDLFRKIRLGVKCFGISIATFVANYYFSVLHSFIALKFFATQNAFEGVVKPNDSVFWFVRQHFSGERTSAPHSFNPLTFIHMNELLFLVFLGSAVTAIFWKKSTLWLFLGYLAIFFFSNLFERRLLPFLVFMIVFGVEGFWQNFISAIKDRSQSRAVTCCIFLACLLIPVIHTRKQAQDLFRETWKANYDLSWEQKFLTRYGRIAEFLPKLEGPILVNGWWREPELSLVYERPFFLRGEVSNQNLPDTFEKLYFLTKNNPGEESNYATTKLCAHVWAQAGDLTLCEFDKKFRLDAGLP